jgi:N-carbamoyl-L-amino-acid hydrolase
VAADELGHAPGFIVTATRILAEPNALTTVPAHVRVWIDARAPSPGDVGRWRDGLEAAALSLSESSGVEIAVQTASRSEGVAFDEGVRAALLRAASDGGSLAAPEVVCFAGHDAGILAERIPAGMVLVRNAAGVSHAPAEHVELGDAAVAANAMLRAVEELA